MNEHILPVSIVIPAKNEEKNIEILLKSIKVQTYQPFEIILSDADSRDDTVKVAKEYGAKVVAGGMPAIGRNNGFRTGIRGNS